MAVAGVGIGYCGAQLRADENRVYIKGSARPGPTCDSTDDVCVLASDVTVTSTCTAAQKDFSLSWKSFKSIFRSIDRVYPVVMLRHVIQGAKKSQISTLQSNLLKRARSHISRPLTCGVSLAPSHRRLTKSSKSSLIMRSSPIIMKSIRHTTYRGFCSSETSSSFKDEDFSTLHAIRVSAQQRYEDRPFLGTKNLSTNEFEYVTYGEFGRKVDQLAGVLVKERGVKPGDKIAVPGIHDGVHPLIEQQALHHGH